MRHRFNYIFFLCILFGAYQQLFPQINFNAMQFSQYTIADGLPGNSIRAVVSDNRGYLWLSVRNNLSRFDGGSFIDYDVFDKGFRAKHGDVRSMIRISDSLLGVITSKGCYVINTDSMKGRSFLVNDSSGSPGAANNVLGFRRLGNGHYVMLTETGLYEFDARARLVYEMEHGITIDSERPSGVHDSGGESLILLRKNLLAYRLASHWKVIDLTTHRVYKNKADHFWRLFNGRVVFRMEVNASEYIFIKANADSIFYMDDRTGAVQGYKLPFVVGNLQDEDLEVANLGHGNFILFNEGPGFYSFSITKSSGFVFNPHKQCTLHFCRSVCRDKASRIWLGTGEGLLKEKSNRTPFETSPIRCGTEAFAYNIIQGINDKLVITSTSIGHALQVLDARTKVLLKELSIDETDTVSRSFYERKMESYYKDTLWISTFSGLFWLDVNNYHYGRVKMPPGHTGADLLLMPPTKDGYAWMSSYTDQCYVRYHIKNRTFEYYNSTTAIKPWKGYQPRILYDADDNVWFYGSGMQRWNSRKQRFDTLIASIGDSSWQESHFHSMIPDKYGGLWIVPVEKDLIRYDVRSHKVERIDLGQHTPIQFYFAFSEIVDDYLWLGSMDHLLGFNIKTREAVFYNRNENMQTWSSDMFYDPKTRLRYMVSGGNQLLSFNNMPQPLPEKDLVPEYLLTMHSVHHHPQDTIRLDYRENTLNIKFTALDFDRDRPAKLAYSIDDSNVWNTIEQSQPVFLYNLAPGWHSLTIHARYKQDGYRPFKMAIYIQPPFWKTAWFLLMVAITLIMLTWAIVRFFMRRWKKEARLILQLKEFELKALHAQMNPHFIFNCLNGIKALIVKGKDTEASDYVSSFSRLVRLNLEHSRKTFITLKENMEYIELYLQSEKLRFTEFTYNITVKEDESSADHIQVVPMLLQPIVENAIWHGLHPVKTERVVNVVYERHGTGARFVIDDNGMGIKKSLQFRQSNSKTSVGMENIKERIKLFNQKYDLNYRIEITDKSDLEPGLKGTKVTIYFDIFTDYD